MQTIDLCFCKLTNNTRDSIVTFVTVVELVPLNSNIFFTVCNKNKNKIIILTNFH